MVCGPAAAEFHSLLYRSYPSGVFWVPNGALLHHAQLVELGDAAGDDELTLGDGLGVRLGGDEGAEDGLLGLGDGLSVDVPRDGPGVGECPGVEVPPMAWASRSLAPAWASRSLAPGWVQRS